MEPVRRYKWLRYNRYHTIWFSLQSIRRYNKRLFHNTTNSAKTNLSLSTTYETYYLIIKIPHMWPWREKRNGKEIEFFWSALTGT